MDMTDNEKYVVRKPIYETCFNIKNRQSPAMTFISEKQISEANYYLELGWIYGMPEPNPYTVEHIHDYDEIILFWGGNPDTPQVLGGEVEYYIGGQPITFNTTAGIFIPKGTRHGPVIWKNFKYPHIEMSLLLRTGTPEVNKGIKTDMSNKIELPEKTEKFDYEQYVIRSPMREAGGRFKSGRQSPTMTYMSSNQINISKYYIEFGWIWGVPDRGLPEMIHDNYDEIVLHIGGDPDDPEDLGADMEFSIGGQLISHNTSNGVFIPKGLRHGPLNWNNVRKPHIEMAIMLGAGTVTEGWKGSFIEDRPED